ncbi:MAG TPA: hypothetical protein VFD26_06765 [Methyloceanibacter sp.]|nr:hypothetical protein [Methyloceanibacter sp.]
MADLFGSAIVLRDMNPRGGVLAGAAAMRGDTVRRAAWPPRKRDAGYADALLGLIERHGEPGGIVYVGDSLLQDGAAIRGLRRAGPPGRVWGFLCCPGVLPAEQGETADGIFLGSEWGSLSAFVESAQEDGLRFGPDIWVLFDLDHTVYGAKGRNDEPLERARSEAVCTYVKSKIPAASFELTRAKRLYSEFEQDRYRDLTQDNLDYVVVLVLAVLCGLADIGAVREYARLADSGIALVIERILSRVSLRADLKASPEALTALEGARLGAVAGNPTPCKEVRRHECLATAEAMLSGADDAERICLNREVVDLLDAVVSAGAQVLAVSDRPVEAAVAECGVEGVDLMNIPMPIRGEPLPFISLRCR